MGLDEKALELAQDNAFANMPSGMTTWSIQLGALIRLAVEIYEQARERVAVPNASLREGASAVLAVEPDFMRLPRHVRVSCYEALAEWAEQLLAQLPAAAPLEWVEWPSREAYDEAVLDAKHKAISDPNDYRDLDDVARDAAWEWFCNHARVAGAVTVDGVIINGVQRDWPSAFKIQQELHADAVQRYVTQIRNLEKRAKRAEDQAGKARCERDEALAARSAWDTWQHWMSRAEAAERELAAERAAHQATKAGLDEAIARGDRLEAKASQLTDMLHAERAAHEALKTKLAEHVKRMGYQNLDDIDADWADYTNDQIRIAAAEKRAAELERELNTVNSYKARSETAESRVAELERERDEAELRAHADKQSVPTPMREEISKGLFEAMGWPWRYEVDVDKYRKGANYVLSLLQRPAAAPVECPSCNNTGLQSAEIDFAAEREAHRLTADAKRVAMERAEAAEAEVSRLKQEAEALEKERWDVVRLLDNARAERDALQQKLDALREWAEHHDARQPPHSTAQHGYVEAARWVLHELKSQPCEVRAVEPVPFAQAAETHCREVPGVSAVTSQLRTEPAADKETP